MPAKRKFTVDFLSGKKFGELSWLRPSHKTDKNVYHDVWQCDCGKIVTLRTGDVVNGRIKSCSCKRFKRGKDSALWTGYEEIPGTFWNALQCNARYRKIKIKLTIEEAWEKFIKQNRKCALTGLPLQFISGATAHDGTASLDRIDSTKDYSIDNVQWVHKTINYIKRDLSDDDFIQWCRKVSAHRK